MSTTPKQFIYLLRGPTFASRSNFRCLMVLPESKLVNPDVFPIKSSMKRSGISPLCFMTQRRRFRGCSSAQGFRWHPRFSSMEPDENTRVFLWVSWASKFSQNPKHALKISHVDRLPMFVKQWIFPYFWRLYTPKSSILIGLSIQ